MVVFLGWNSNFEKKVRGAYYKLLILYIIWCGCLVDLISISISISISIKDSYQ